MINLIDFSKNATIKFILLPVNISKINTVLYKQLFIYYIYCYYSL